MTTVDNRIVSMKFDNSAFEQKLSDTINSLDKLRASLDFSNSTRGMNELGNASRSFSMGTMGSEIDGVSAKFLALATVGITVLSSLVSKAVDAGLRIGKALTIAPVMGGFREYELNMNSIQTILANTESKGSNLQDVNAALQQLNVYADQTIYNFGQMARNIGTFTAAGVNLQTSVDAIKGIANLAAIAGSNSQQASTAMYQLSQAIAAGSVKLQDWNSVVNAGLGGEVFKSALFETGKAMGTLKNVPMDQTFQQWEKAGNSFRTSLSGTGKAVDSVADKVAKASSESGKAIKAAESSAADAVESATERVKSARESAAKSAKDSAKTIADAHKAQAASAIKSADDLKKALDSVTAAQKRLENALKPASADELEAATDGLTTAQLDQADSANDIEQALRQQKRATEDLASAEANLKKVQSSKKSTKADRVSAQRQLEDAQTKSADLSDAIERARLKQNSATRTLTASEAKLAEVKKKGTEEDTQVIDARQALLNAEEAVVKTRESNAEREIEAAQRIADVMESTSERQIAAQKSIADAEKSLAKTRASSAESVARAHESAAERMKAASEDVNTSGKGWLTSEVLTNTLKGFTGDLTDEQILAMGYTKEQMAQIKKMGALGVESATKVKTLTQLIGTVKEAFETGWKDTFDILVGDIQEAKGLFTNINDGFTKLADSSTNARNELLKGWKDLGGRTLLIEAFSNAIKAIGSVIRPIKEAFKEIFPPTTAKQLFDLTERFARFTKSLIIGDDIADKIKRTFAGLFAVIKIGVAIVKGIFGVFSDLVGAILPTAGGGVLLFTSSIGDMLVALSKVLVDGGAIKNFFARLGDVFVTPIKFINQLKDAIGAFFNGFAGGEVAEGVLGRVETRFEGVTNAAKKFSDGWTRLSIILDQVWTYISGWFSQLGDRIADLLKPDDFNATIDIINVGLLGGILLMLKRFVKNGFKFDFGGGFFDKIGKVFDGLTSKMKAMQANVKADTMMKIAIALGILTISVVALSLIDSAALTKALTAIAVGFGQLATAMAILTKMSGGPAGAVKVGILAASLILLAGAMVILSIAIKNLSTLSWSELAKGLIGISVGLAALTIATRFIALNTTGLISAGIAMIAISIGLWALSKAVKSFAELSLVELAKGFIGVAAGLVIIGLAMRLMPKNMFVTAAGLVLVGIALNVIALAVKSFAELSLAEMAKGLIGVAGALVIIGLAMRLMPKSMPLTAAGLTLVGIALNVIALAVKSFADLSWGEMVRGLTSLAATLVILAVALKAMTGTAAGAASLLVASAALLVLAGVLKVIGSLSLAELATGLAGMAAVFVILGVAATFLGPLSPVLMSLGVAMAVVGGAFALFGIGAMLVAKAFELMAKAGKVGVNVLIEVIKALITALPDLISAFVKSLGHMAGEFLTAGKLIIKLLGEFLIMFLDKIIELTPRIAKAFGTIVSEGLRLIREKFPEVLQTGIDLLLELLRGIRDNIGKIVTLAVDIIIEFTKALGSNALKLINAGADILIQFLNGLAETIRTKTPEIREAGLNVIIAIIDGMTFGLASKAEKVLKSLGNFATGMISSVTNVLKSSSPSKVFIGIGKSIPQGLVKALDSDTTAKNSAVQHAERIIKAFQESLSKVPDSLAGMAELNPVITPVLDLTKVQLASRNLDRLMAVSAITPEVSYARARLISTTTDLESAANETPAYTGPAEVTFEQNIYAPTALSTNDIYRNTKSQIVLAKEELGIS